MNGLDPFFTTLYLNLIVKGLVVELTPPHAQSVWGSRGERVRTVGLTTYCNYFSEKKKKSLTSYLFLNKINE